MAQKANLAADIKKATSKKQAPERAKDSGIKKNISKGVSLPPEQWELLKKVSRAREDREDERFKISAIIQDLISRHEPELRREIES
jgi:hypothetical protein